MDIEAFRAYTRINRVVAIFADAIKRGEIGPNDLDAYPGMIDSLTAVQEWIFNQQRAPLPNVLPRGLCGTRGDHASHDVRAGSLAPYWCSGREADREPARSERHRASCHGAIGELLCTPDEHRNEGAL